MKQTETKTTQIRNHTNFKKTQLRKADAERGIRVFHLTSLVFKQLLLKIQQNSHIWTGTLELIMWLFKRVASYCTK